MGLEGEMDAQRKRNPKLKEGKPKEKRNKQKYLKATSDWVSSNRISGQRLGALEEPSQP